MIRPDTRLRVYLCREPVDMRKQIDGLALLIQEGIELLFLLMVAVIHHRAVCLSVSLGIFKRAMRS
ncbi:IS66 family insertion sequence element accessory protein TnpB [Halomonas vilamensis]|uniref:IS66 family insertion sequence element accessory protein TnpB n=1 Tax=Vreelandella vilamensis TaxID=531309 RepID=A0ABU1H852_9GAMM|nr:IS66 family insertion sequence element accessory protein TnpB [Halomonas vilamensis]MDR5900399.1 IS66 family insertion sequence element accessory protein TnpB [Halomonas vilamensis]